MPVGTYGVCPVTFAHHAPYPAPPPIFAFNCYIGLGVVHDDAGAHSECIRSAVAFASASFG